MRDDWQKQFGLWFAGCREARQLSKGKCARQMGVDPSTLQRVEGGERPPSLEFLIRGALALRVPIEEMFEQAGLPAAPRIIGDDPLRLVRFALAAGGRWRPERSALVLQLLGELAETPPVGAGPAASAEDGTGAAPPVAGGGLGAWPGRGGFVTARG